MITQEDFNKGWRCKGICTFCKDAKNCIQHLDYLAKDRNTLIMNRLQEHLDLACKKVSYDRIVGIFLQGSQNYGLDYADSDIDSKVIVVPSIDDIVLNKKPISETLLMPNNEHVDLKDIRLMFGCFKKQNINFVEILFTDFMILNPAYLNIFYEEVLYYREDIARYSEWNALNCIKGMMMEKFKALKHPYPTLADRIERFSYDPKQLHHMFRIYEFGQRYINGESYSECLISKQKDFLINVKNCSNGAFYNLEEAEKHAESLLYNTDAMIDLWRQSHDNSFNIKVEEQLNRALSIIIKDSFKKEL